MTSSFPTSIAAAHFSRLAISTDNTAVGTALTTPTEANLKLAFDAVGDYVEVGNIRDMPQIGDPANIVNVPVYGQATTMSVGAQADAPSLELTINYVPSLWTPSSTLGGYVQDGVSKLFQFAFLPAPVADLATNASTGSLRNKPNALFYFWGRIESLLVTPARDDAATATVSLSLQSKFYGPYTV